MVQVQVQGCRGEFGKSGKPGRTLCISRYVSGVAILLVESGVGWNRLLWFCSMFQNICSTFCWKLFQVFREEYLRKRRYQIKQCPGSSLAPLTHTRFYINNQFLNHCFKKKTETVEIHHLWLVWRPSFLIKVGPKAEIWQHQQFNSWATPAVRKLCTRVTQLH